MSTKMIVPRSESKYSLVAASLVPAWACSYTLQGKLGLL